MAKKVDHAGVAAILAERGIVGMIEGRTEVGPRALGHRSLLAYPASNEVKDKLNQLKVRQWYRPSAREQSKAKRASARANDRPGGRKGRAGRGRAGVAVAPTDPVRLRSAVGCGASLRQMLGLGFATQRDTLQHSAWLRKRLGGGRYWLPFSGGRCRYRPVAPIVAVEYTSEFIEHPGWSQADQGADSFSPYMSFSPRCVPCDVRSV